MQMDHLESVNQICCQRIHSMHGVAYLHIFVPTKKLKFKKSYPLCHCMKEWSLQQLDVSHHGDPIPVIG